MKIDKVSVDKINHLGNVNRASRGSVNLHPDVSLKISELAQKISKIQEEVPATEARRIDQLHLKIQQGDYKIDHEKIARVLLDLQEKE